jgi:hypothetical protein
MKSEVYKSKGMIFTARFWFIVTVALLLLVFVGSVMQCIGVLP